jgi:hypothetical protein
MTDFFDFGLIVAAGFLFIWGARKYDYSKPRRFPGPDGRKWTWHPGGSFSDPDGRPVTDEDGIAACEAAWIEWHERTRRETTAILTWRSLRDD